MFFRSGKAFKPSCLLVLARPQERGAPTAVFLWPLHLSYSATTALSTLAEFLSLSSLDILLHERLIAASLNRCVNSTPAHFPIVLRTRGSTAVHAGSASSCKCSLSVPDNLIRIDGNVGLGRRMQ